MSDGERTFINSRMIPASAAEIMGTFRDPQRLARWWGPDGFSNTFHEYDFRPGGAWNFTMHGPDGADYENHCRFDEISDYGVTLTHLATVHHFILTIALEPVDRGTLLTWRQTFDTPEEYARVQSFVPRCNEENLARLEAELKRP